MLAVTTDPSQDWVLTLFKVVAVFAVVMPMVAYSVVAERRISAWIQDRVGPNRVGIPFTNIRLLGLGQPLAAGLQALGREPVAEPSLVPDSIILSLVISVLSKLPRNSERYATLQ